MVAPSDFFLSVFYFDFVFVQYEVGWDFVNFYHTARCTTNQSFQNTYIYIYLLIYYLPVFTVTRKKKSSGTRDKNISNHRPGEKEKIS